MRTTALLWAIAAFVAAVTAASGTAAAGATLFVDDDGVQCPNADFTTIQAAVTAAAPDTMIRVCPGVYSESVVADKPLRLHGQIGAVDAVDCFDPALPTADPNTQAIVVPPAGATATAVLFDLQADNIELQGFVLLGPTGSTSRGVMTSSAHSGYRIHHNLIVATTVAAYFRSSGADPSSFAHNCLRDNRSGLVNQFLPLSNARIHHNSTFRTAAFTYEQTPNCPQFLETGVFFPCSKSTAGMDRVLFDHNTSSGDATVYRFASSTSTTASENTVISADRAMLLFGSNHDLHIIDNDLEVRLVGLARGSGAGGTTGPEPSNFRVLIRGNTITSAPGSVPSVQTAGIGMGIGGLKNSWIFDNVISGIDGYGIALRVGNTDNLVRGNTVTNNGRDGIWAEAGATGNTFEANEIIGNGNGTLRGVDARDDAREFNVWRGNVCLTDLPVGTICGIG